MAKAIPIPALFKKYKDKVSFIDTYLEGFDAELRQLQRELAMMIVADYAPLFETNAAGNIILDSNANIKLMGQLDRVFDKFKKTFAENTYKGTAEAMLKMTGLTSDYFRTLDPSRTFGKKTLVNIEKKLKAMQKTIGIDAKTGKVIEGSFIDNLAKTPQTRSVLAEYVRKSIEGQASRVDFTKGLRDLIEGTPDANGTLVQYQQSYVDNVMRSHSRSLDNFFADELGLNKAYYAGDVIKTSRPFCMGGYDDICECTFERKAGKTFTRGEIMSWQKLNWRGKRPGDDILTNLGGSYGPCRHNLMWIPDEIPADDMAAEDENL